LCDNEAQLYTYRLGGDDGVLVQSYWSTAWSTVNNAYIVPDGNAQNFFVSAGTLTINGDQLANKDDVIEIGLTPKGRLSVTLNGETATFDVGAINNIVVNTFTGKNVVKVHDTSVPVMINDGGMDTVLISDMGSVQRIFAPVNVNSLAQATKLIVDDSADPVGQKKVMITSTQIRRLANADILYNGQQLTGLEIYGGHGVNTYNVLSTPKALVGERGVPVMLYLSYTSSIGGVVGGTNTVNVGSSTNPLNS